MTNDSSRKFIIVVGIQFDETGTNALREAVSAATTRTGAELHVVYVIPNSDSTTRSTKVLARRSDALASAPRTLRAFVAAQSKNIEKLATQKVVMHARLGAPADAILQLAADVNADLIVVGTHGYRGMRRVVLGSVAQDLVEIARCPVLIARPRDYKGIAPSPAAEPVCAECAKTRAATHGEKLWCEYHSRPQVRPHVWQSSEVFHVGGHDPGLIANGG
jgi:nucleotide-binding universal stress UspA family protein